MHKSNGTVNGIFPDDTSYPEIIQYLFCIFVIAFFINCDISRNINDKCPNIKKLDS